MESGNKSWMTGWVRDLLFYWVFLTGGEAIKSLKPSKILMIPYAMGSHVHIFTTLGKHLTDDGHDVWMLSFNKYKAVIEERGITPLTFNLKPEDDLQTKIDEWMAESPDWEDFNVKLSTEDWLMAYSRTCDQVMTDQTIQNTLQHGGFDLIILHHTEPYLCYLMIPYKFDIPFISFLDYQTTSWVSGVTGMPSIEPELSKALSNKMNFWERIENAKSWWEMYHNVYYDIYQHHMEKYCPPHKPKIPLKKVAEMAEMYLMNYEVMCLDYPRVSAPNLQYLGPTTADTPRPLPDDLETFMSGAEKGVILMTLGTKLGVQQIWKIIGDKIFEAFSRLPQRVVVQYTLDEDHGKVPDNVMLRKWVPQNDILGHPKTKLFVMHGGNNGQNEAIYHGVPMLVLPVFMEQLYNAKRVQTNGFGEFVSDFKVVTSDELYEIIVEIINNGSYTAKARKCSAIIRSMPSAQEKFVFWVNHILQFGGAHLRPPSLDMPLYQVLMLDILAYYVILALLVTHAALCLLYFVIKFFKSYHKAKMD